MKIAALVLLIQWSIGVATGVAAPVSTVSEPDLGDACYGYEIGRRAPDPATGQPIICDSDYTWNVDIGQVPGRWFD